MPVAIIALFVIVAGIGAYFYTHACHHEHYPYR